MPQQQPEKTTEAGDNALPMPMLSPFVYSASGYSTLPGSPPWQCAVVSPAALDPLTVARIAVAEVSQQPQEYKDLLSIADRIGFYTLVKVASETGPDWWVPNTLVLYERGYDALATLLASTYQGRYGTPMRTHPFHFRPGKTPYPEPAPPVARRTRRKKPAAKD